MSTPNTITIDNVKYIREDSIVNSNNSGEKDMRIFVLPRSWNLVGEYNDDGKGNITIKNASVIRVWGTTKGLGQIAKDGPTKDTKLDKCNGDVKVSLQNILLTIDCEVSKW